MSGTSARSAGQAQKHQQRAVEPQQIVIRKAADALAQGDWARIEKLAREARQIKRA